MNALRLVALHIRLLMSNLTIAAAEARDIYSPLLYKERATIRGHIAMLETVA